MKRIECEGVGDNDGFFEMEASMAKDFKAMSDALDQADFKFRNQELLSSARQTLVQHKEDVIYGAIKSKLGESLTKSEMIEVAKSRIYMQSESLNLNEAWFLDGERIVEFLGAPYLSQKDFNRGNHNPEVYIKYKLF